MILFEFVERSLRYPEPAPTRLNRHGTAGGVFGLILLLRGVAAPAFLENRLGHRLQSPDQAQPRKHLQAVVGDVNFPPVEPVAGAALETMVVVVPAFTQTDQGENETVAGIV